MDCRELLNQNPVNMDLYAKTGPVPAWGWYRPSFGAWIQLHGEWRSAQIITLPIP